MQGAIVVKTILQIALMPVVPCPFIYWLTMEFAFAILGAIVLNKVMKKEYPWLSTSNYDGRILLKEMPEIMKKTKQVFIHKFSGVVLGSCAPLVMYTFSSLTIVAYYGNYQLIVGKVGYLLQTVFNSTTAGVGNLIASGDNIRIQNVFWELFDSRLYFSMTALLTIYFVVQPFITVWLGIEYLLSDFFIITVILTTAITVNRATVDSFIAGYGLFSDVWAPVVETILNLGGSFLFGYLLGFEGVLIGVILSQLLIICLWKPYFLYTKGMCINATKFFIPLLLRLTIIGLDFIVFRLLFKWYNLSDLIEGYTSWFLFSVIVFLFVGIILFIEFYLITSGMQSFVKRMSTILINKVK